MTNKYYIARKEMRSVDRIINDTIENPNYFRDNMVYFLDKVNTA